MKFDFVRLYNSVESSIQQIGKPRKERNDALRQYVGMHYADDGAPKVVPTNFLELAVTIYARRLAARAPRVIVNTGIQSLLPAARDMEIALNQIPDEIFLGRTLRRAVIEAIFGIGIIKTGICTTGHTVLGHKYGESFADVVTLDNYFLDMAAKKMEAIKYEGNDYWLPLDAVRDMAGSSKIEADSHMDTGDDGQDRAESIGTSEAVEDYIPQVLTRDVWLPDTGQIVTYGVKSKKQFSDPIDWDGPGDGPYHKLTYSDVPGNLLPLAPVALLIDLHELANNLFRKLGNQADAKKTVAAFQGGNEASVMALQKAADGGGIVYSGAKPEDITVGGIDQATLAFFLQIKGIFSYLAGNLDSLGGLAPQTDTVGQDEMLSAAANGRIDYMEDQTVDFAKAIFKDLAWFEWTDPVRQRAIEKPIEGTDIVLHRVWSQETRSGDFLDYNLDIDAYSMKNDTPSIRLQKIGQIFEQYIVPLLPMIEKQGGQIDVNELLTLIGRLSNLPELATLIKFQEQDQSQQQPLGNPQPAFAPANTTRTYKRVNVPGASQAGKDDVMSRLLMGGNVQKDEANSLGRSVS